jgi:hypothetical protein
VAAESNSGPVFFMDKGVEESFAANYADHHAYGFKPRVART